MHLILFTYFLNNILCLLLQFIWYSISAYANQSHFNVVYSQNHLKHFQIDISYCDCGFGETWSVPMALYFSGLGATIFVCLTVTCHTNITLTIISSSMGCSTTSRFVIEDHWVKQWSCGAVATASPNSITSSAPKITSSGISFQKGTSFYIAFERVTFTVEVINYPINTLIK